MSGKRCKALRRKYLRSVGHPPEKTRWNADFSGHTPSIWRLVKANWKRWRPA